MANAERGPGCWEPRDGKRGRLLIAISALGGGTGAHLAKLLDQLSPDKWTIRVLCIGQRDSEVPDHVELIEDPSQGPLHRFPLAQWRQLRTLESQIRDFRPDVVHTYFLWPILYGRLLKRKGVIQHLVENREDQGFNLSTMDYYALRATAAWPQRVICVSEAVRNVVRTREGLRDEQIQVIRNGVQLPDPSVVVSEETELREELGIPADAPVVGIVANLNREVKGVKYFVEAAALILDKVPSTYFLVLGEGHLRSGLEERARCLGLQERMVFAGFRTDIQRFYTLMDVSTLSSLSEGLSITILESMSFGLPVVATKVGGNPELVEHGVTGLLVPPRNPPAFAAAVAQMLRNPKRAHAMGSAGRTAVERHSIAATARQYHDLYCNLCRAPG